MFYEEERQKAKARQVENAIRLNTDLGRETKGADLHSSTDMPGDVAEILAKKVGMSRRNLYYLLAVYRNRADLFEQVFSGTISINKAYTQMKADEAPDELPKEEPVMESAKELIERTIHEEHLAPQIDESQPDYSPHNRIVTMRKRALALTSEVLSGSDKIKEVNDRVRESVRNQLMALARSCMIALGETADKDDDADILLLCLELLEEIDN